ncbi:MAG: exodeoxyribonuclease VII large subunit [Candidatus Moranbacteria bacterium]|nr:exodeoxyribonuclease VII large subunit [Candidatus Moranbacteria bacterium]
MNKIILEKLKKWQTERARRDNVEAYRVLPYSTLEEIARREPQNAEELLEVKGIKEKKLARYGKEILAIVNEADGEENIVDIEKEDRIFEVGEYLDYLNIKLLESEAKIKGEVSSVENRGNYIFFGIKDKEGESLLNCFIWGNDYSMSGVDLEEGTEVIIWGYPNVYKPSGRMSFQTKLIEVVGEGALKKAYDELKRKLEAEGIFAPERKKIIPDFSHKIGLITSHQGAAIGDFTTNLGSYGFDIKFYSSRVEGKQAVFDLVKAMKWFNKNMPDLDAIVLVRGGGSLESLQAFNTESLVREIADSKIPVLAGVGHEQDVTLAALAADKMVSTPTGAAVELTKSWDEAANKVDAAERELVSYLSGIFERFDQAKIRLHREFEKIGQAVFYSREKIDGFSKNVSIIFGRCISETRETIRNIESQLNLNNPERQLKLGYSLVSLRGKIVRSVKNVNIGDDLNIKVGDGEIESEIRKIHDL